MTIRQVDIHPEALAEAEAAVAWYAERSSRAPAAFIEEIDNTIQSILKAPKRWPILEWIFGGCLCFNFHTQLCIVRNQTISSKSSQSPMAGEGQAIGRRGIVRPIRS